MTAIILGWALPVGGTLLICSAIVLHPPLPRTAALFAVLALLCWGAFAALTWG